MSGGDSTAMGPMGQAGVTLIGLWVDVAVVLALGFVFSFFWTSTTAIYFLLRRQVDATEMDEVYLPDEQQPYGLPSLEEDAAGVAGVGDALQFARRRRFSAGIRVCLRSARSSRPAVTHTVWP